MKRAFLVFVLSVFFAVALGACSSGAPSEAAIQTAIAQTAESVPAETDTPIEAVPTETETPNPTSEPEKEEEFTPALEEEFLKDIDYHEDQISGTIYLSYRKAARHDFETIIYFFNGSDQAEVGMIDTYTGDDWLFINSVIINADDERYFLDLCESNTDVLDGGKIEEFIVVCLDSDDAKMVEQIYTSDEVLVRFNGREGNHDFELGKREKDNLHYMYQLYTNLLDGTIEIRDGLGEWVEGQEEPWWE